MRIDVVLPLPYQIPVNLNHYFAAEAEGKIKVAVEFDLKRSNYSMLNYFHNIGIMESQDQTIAIIHIDNINQQIDDGIIQELVHIAIEYVNSIIQAFRAVSDIMHIKPIVITDLPMTIPIVVDNHIRMYVTHPNKLYDDNVGNINNKQVTEMFLIIKDWQDKKGIKYPNEYFFQAKTDIVGGRHRDGIINLQTSFEIYINKVLRNGYNVMNLPDTEIDRLIDEVSFANKVKQELKKTLIDKFDPEKCNEYNNWKNYLYNKRNEIVHKGLRELTKNDGYNALKAYCEFYNYIGKFIIKKRIVSSIYKLNYGSLQRSIKDPKILSILKNKIFSIK